MWSIFRIFSQVVVVERNVEAVIHPQSHDPGELKHGIFIHAGAMLFPGATDSDFVLNDTMTPVSSGPIAYFKCRLVCMKSTVTGYPPLMVLSVSRGFVNR